jgi:hypothetical protein
MRKATLLLLFTLAGCARLTALVRPAPPFVIGADGRTVTAGGETWSAPDDVQFYQRGALLHVVSMVQGQTWDVAVALDADGRLAWPAEGPFEAVEGALKLRVGEASPAVERLLETGQIHVHDDHYHLTHALEDPDWQALYRDRAEGSALDPVRRQVAATVLALLLDQRIPGAGAEVTEKALQRMRSIIAKARRAVEGGVGARAIEMIIAHDLEIRDDGRTLEVGGQVYRASDGVRFAYCTGHFHVEDARGKWTQPVEVEGQAPGTFQGPSSIFFEVREGGTIAERSTPSRWRTLSDRGEIHFARDHWHVTEAYANPRMQYVLKTMADAKVAAPIRDRARAMAFELMRLRLDTGSDAEFDARLDAVDQAIDRAAAELERERKQGGR